MKAILKMYIGCILFALIMSNVYAEDVKKADSVKKEERKVLNPWIDCGIGAMIFNETEWAAVTSNITWDLGTTAVTSDYSSQNTCNSKKAQTAMYISATYANLEEETVKGNGQHVHAMLNIMGCNPTKHESIIHSIRNDFSKYLQNPSYQKKTTSDKAQDYYNLVNSKIGQDQAGQCQVL